MNGELAQHIEKEVVDELLTEKTITVGFKRLSESAVLPTKAHATDSGFDICASADVIIEPGTTVIVPTDIALDLPAGYEAVIRPRSGVTAKTKLRIAIGTVDQSYKGALGVIVDNIASVDECDKRAFVLQSTDGNRLDGDDEAPALINTYLIRKHDRIAQIVIQRLPDVIGVEVADVGESERGEGGFGSSGFVADAIRRSYE